MEQQPPYFISSLEGSSLSQNYLAFVSRNPLVSLSTFSFIIQKFTHRHLRIRFPLSHPSHILPRTHISLLSFRRWSLSPKNIDPTSHYLRHSCGNRLTNGSQWQRGFRSNGSTKFFFQFDSRLYHPIRISDAHSYLQISWQSTKNPENNLNSKWGTSQKYIIWCLSVSDFSDSLRCVSSFKEKDSQGNDWKLSSLRDWHSAGNFFHVDGLEQYQKILQKIHLLQGLDWINVRSLLYCNAYGLHCLPHCQVRIVNIFLFSKKPLFSNGLLDKKTPMNIKSFIGYILAGIGLGLGGMLFDSFLLTVPSSEIRIAVFWGVPCIFSIKAVQVLSLRSELPPV